ncbi:hypothetical protein POM88_045216 [Heracleum sosnowskyi]|uniref:EXS domain-containing protein n=1 Tax=Heracleum sosnowskyi TaxID=360622 RepID=A0AAD8H455_9APIA|nr:hypothetical protein POM88_045216 [Heracleum sosnowskyi]
MRFENCLLQALNIVLRVAWLETVMKFNLGIIESRLLDFFLASLEVSRRGHWNFYRLENEHLNNSGNYRAVKAVPLPFRECDSDGWKSNVHMSSDVGLIYCNGNGSVIILSIFNLRALGNTDLSGNYLVEAFWVKQ